MKHTVSFETAKALKAAGYPQPEFETGQIWYNWNGVATCIGPMGGNKGYRHLFSLGSGDKACMIPVSDESFYAPSATEIMEEPIMWNHNLEYCVLGWSCHEDQKLIENPAEAAAELWLKLNAK